MAAPLSILGGSPVRTRPWPKWPRASASTQRNLLDVLHSTKWAISGHSDRVRSYEHRLGEASAKFFGTDYCVPCANGSAALTMALEALNVGWGDEVLVPGLTWVACPSAVVRVGAVPILVDIDQSTLCMSLEAAEAAITDRTAAIMIVHLYCSFADIDGFVALSRRTGIPLIEDCSQAHGAIWNAKRVGTFGDVGAFSTQQSKLLTSGEGGLCLTSSEDLFLRMQQLRADGRVYRNLEREPQVLADFKFELSEKGDIAGRNLCMSEFHAAILLDALERLDDENRHRQKNAASLETQLMEVDGVELIACPKEIELRTFYRVCLRLDRRNFGMVPIEVLSKAITTELGINVDLIDCPLNRHPLYKPLKSSRIPKITIHEMYNPERFDLPTATKSHQECITLPHQVLLGDYSEIEDIVKAIRKVKDNCLYLSAR